MKVYKGFVFFAVGDETVEIGIDAVEAALARRGLKLGANSDHCIALDVFHEMRAIDTAPRMSFKEHWERLGDDDGYVEVKLPQQPHLSGEHPDAGDQDCAYG